MLIPIQFSPMQFAAHSSFESNKLLILSKDFTQANELENWELTEHIEFNSVDAIFL